MICSVVCRVRTTSNKIKPHTPPIFIISFNETRNCDFSLPEMIDTICYPAILFLVCRRRIHCYICVFRVAIRKNYLLFILFWSLKWSKPSESPKCERDIFECVVNAKRNIYSWFSTSLDLNIKKNKLSNYSSIAFRLRRIKRSWMCRRRDDRNF